MESIIVDKEGLSHILKISESLIDKTWREYPHFFVGQAKTGKSVRFDIDDVVRYLKKRDYHANTRQENSSMDSKGENFRLSDKVQKRIPDKKAGCTMGDRPDKSSKKSSSRSIQEFKRCFGLS